jgi:hypothetical protein
MTKKKIATVTGWKVFDKDLKCRNYQFEVGKRYTHDGNPSLCHNGFHYHHDKLHLFNYYSFDPTNRVCEIIAHGKIDKGDDKSCTNEIEIVRELSWNDVLNLINIGAGNSGKYNTGHRNAGHQNAGDWNTGHQNTGQRNAGDQNTGHQNAGDWNTGDWNSTNYSAGIFNTIEQPTPIFNGAANVIMSEFRNTDNYKVLFSSNFPLTEWIHEGNMTDEEKAQQPKFHVQEGYLKKRTFHEACKIWWDKMADRNKSLIQSISGFTPSIFTEVTGIKL